VSLLRATVEVSLNCLLLSVLGEHVAIIPHKVFDMTGTVENVIVPQKGRTLVQHILELGLYLGDECALFEFTAGPRAFLTIDAATPLAFAVGGPSVRLLAQPGVHDRLAGRRVANGKDACIHPIARPVWREAEVSLSQQCFDVCGSLPVVVVEHSVRIYIEARVTAWIVQAWSSCVHLSPVGWHVLKRNFDIRAVGILLARGSVFFHEFGLNSQLFFVAVIRLNEAPVHFHVS